MRTTFPLLVVSVLTLTAFASVFQAVNQHISRDVYLDLVFYLKYSSSAYALLCPHPNGQILVEAFRNILTETQGFIARDDSRREIVVAMRGSFSFMDIFTDIGVIPIPFTSPGVTAPSGAMVHAGFLTGWNSVAKIVLRSVGFQLQAHPGYSLVSTGHSLGGALASLAAMSFKANFPYTNVTVYTYGQPRTGNTVYAEWVNNELGGNVFRSVHTYDGVPTIIPTGMFPSLRDQAGTVKRAQNGYRHHGIEYWQNTEPASENATLRCADDGEDPDCSASIWSTGVNVAHFAYFGIPAIQPFCFKKVQTETYSSLRSTDAIQDLVDKHEGTNIGQDVAR